MKKSMLVIASAIVLLLSFRNDFAYRFSPPKAVRVPGVFYDSINRQLRVDVIMRISHDTFNYVDISKTKADKKWFRDTRYYYISSFDTAVDRVTKKIIIDSTNGLPVVVPIYSIVTKKYVYLDGNLSLDSLGKSLESKGLIGDTTRKK